METLILGQDLWVFVAWIGCILSTMLCIFYWVYCEYVRKDVETRGAKESG